MKKLIILLLSAFIAGSFAPLDDYDYLPILIKKTDLPNSISFEQARELKNTGKIYVYGNYLFIGEKYKGVHIINNSNPSNPINERFISVPGCLDIAVKGSIVYVDNATDLVAIDITDFDNMVVTKRIADAFPEPQSPDGFTPWEFSIANRPEGTVIIEWVKNN